MPNILKLVSVYVGVLTIAVFLVASGLVKPLPWLPVFSAFMLVGGIVFLRIKGSESVAKDSKYLKSPRRHWFLARWALLFFSGALYSVLKLLTGRGNQTDVAAAVGGAGWGSFLVFVLWNIYRNKKSASSRPGP